MILEALDVFGFCIGACAAILIGYKNKYGFLCFAAHNTCYLTIGYFEQRYGLMSSCMLFLIMDIYFFIRWSKVE